VCIDEDGNIKIVDFENAFSLPTLPPKFRAELARMMEDTAGWTEEQYMDGACEERFRDCKSWIGRYVPLYTPAP